MTGTAIGSGSAAKFRVAPRLASLCALALATTACGAARQAPASEKEKEKAGSVVSNPSPTPKPEGPSGPGSGKVDQGHSRIDTAAILAGIQGGQVDEARIAALLGPELASFGERRVLALPEKAAPFPTASSAEDPDGPFWKAFLAANPTLASGAGNPFENEAVRAGHDLAKYVCSLAAHVPDEPGLASQTGSFRARALAGCGAAKSATFRYATGIDPNKAFFAAYASSLAYAADSDAGIKAFVDHGADRVKVVTFPSSDTAVYTAFFGNLVLVAARGTTSREGWANNLTTEGVPADFFGLPATPSVHKGFSQTVRSAWPTFDGHVKEKAALPDVRFVVTGHSRGGALATLLALKIADAYGKPAEVVTFGAPRVGDAAFVAEATKKLGPSAWRFEFAEDPVPHLPPRRDAVPVFAPLVGASQGLVPK